MAQQPPETEAQARAEPASAAAREKPVPMRVLLPWAMAVAPVVGLGLPLAVQIPPLYNQLGLGLATVGLIFMLGRGWDIVSDPIMGYLIDRFPSRWGRRKHWLALSTPLFVVAGIMLFQPPENPSPLWLAAGLFCGFTAFTLFHVSHLSWGYDLTPSYRQRSRIYTWRGSLEQVFLIAVLVIPAIGEALGWDFRTKVASMGWFIVATAIVTHLLCLYRVPDGAAGGGGGGGQSAEGVQARAIASGKILELVRERLVWRLCFMECMHAVTPAVAGALYIFVVRDHLLLGDQSAIVLLLYFLGALLALPLWLRLSYRLGKDRTLVLVLLCQFVAPGLVWLIAVPGDFGRCCIALFVLAVPHAAPGVLVRSMTQDLVDHHLAETGEDFSGMVNAAITSSSKLGFAMGSGIVLVLADLWLGYDAKADNSPQTVANVYILWLVVPAGAALVAISTLLGYPLTEKRHREIQQALGRD